MRRAPGSLGGRVEALGSVVQGEDEPGHAADAAEVPARCPLGRLASGRAALAGEARRVEPHQAGPPGEGMANGGPLRKI